MALADEVESVLNFADRSAQGVAETTHPHLDGRSRLVLLVALACEDTFLTHFWDAACSHGSETSRTIISAT